MYDIHSIGSDAAKVLAMLWRQTFLEAYHDIHTSENIDAYCARNFTLEVARAELRDDKTICKLAYHAGVPVGFYLLKKIGCPFPLPGPSIELKQIYILASHYGKGLGRLLYADALSVMRDHGAAWVWLCVSDKNIRAQKFYAKLEFSEKGPGPTFEVGTDRLPSTVMARALGAG